MNQQEIEDHLRQIGDFSTLRLLAEIKKLMCENARLRVQTEKPLPPYKTNGGGVDD